MKRFILAALVAVPLVAAAGQTAHAGDCCSQTFRLGFSIAFKGWAGCSCDPGCNPNPNPCCGSPCGPCGGCNSAPVNWGQLAPWYLYWPYDGHFQTPAPTGFPSYPPNMTAPALPMGAAPAGYGNQYGYVPPTTFPGTSSMGHAAPQVQPAAYYPQVQPAAYYPQTQGYYYGR